MSGTGQVNGVDNHKKSFEEPLLAKDDQKHIRKDSDFTLMTTSGISNLLKKPHRRDFEDARKTTRTLHNQLLMERGMMAFSLLCMVLSLSAKEIEINRMVKGNQ
jgi:hypothetical protein